MRPIATGVARSVICLPVCLLGTQFCCAKTAESIDMRFEELTHVFPRNYVRWGLCDFGNIVCFICLFFRFTIISITLPCHYCQLVAFVIARRSCAKCDITQALSLIVCPSVCLSHAGVVLHDCL